MAEFLRLAWPAMLTGILYVWQGFLMLQKGDIPFAVVWWGYAVAQVGLIMMAGR